MKRNNNSSPVPFKTKGGSRSLLKALKPRMWYIGITYRASKGQYMHNKFINRFFFIFLKWIKKFSLLVRVRFFSKLYNQKLALTSKISIYGSIVKFEKNYITDAADGQYLYLPKNYGLRGRWNTPSNSNYAIISSGVTYLPAQDIGPDLLIEEGEEVGFFRKFQLEFFLIEDFFIHTSTTTIHNTLSLTTTTLIDFYFLIEIYKIHLYIISIKTSQ